MPMQKSTPAAKEGCAVLFVCRQFRSVYDNGGNFIHIDDPVKHDCEQAVAMAVFHVGISLAVGIILRW